MFVLGFDTGPQLPADAPLGDNGDAQVVGSLPPRWETWTELLALSLGPDHSDWCGYLGSDPVDGSSVCVSASQMK